MLLYKKTSCFSSLSSSINRACLSLSSVFGDLYGVVGFVGNFIMVVRFFLTFLCQHSLNTYSVVEKIFFLANPHQILEVSCLPRENSWPNGTPEKRFRTSRHSVSQVERQNMSACSENLRSATTVRKKASSVG